MFLLLKNALCYNPGNIGVQDVLICNGKIILIQDEIKLPDNFNAQILDCKKLSTIPGLIDQHVHILGGGGENGPKSRVPELMLGQILKSGITTLVGVLGFDDICRSIPELLAKGRGLEEEGISTYIYTGSYSIPTKTATGKILNDIVYIDKVIGVGEIAISDYRSSHPDLKQLQETAAEAIKGGMITGKAGIVHIHTGDGKGGLSPLKELLRYSDYPKSMFIPTHINRNFNLMDEGISYVKSGGFIDLTAGQDPKTGPTVKDSVIKALKSGCSMDNISVTSDGNGSIPSPDGKIKIGKVDELFEDFKACALSSGIGLEIAVKLFSVNPSKFIKIDNFKGKIQEGYDADILVLDEKMNIRHLIAKGKVLIKDGVQIKYGTFENSK